MPDSPATDSKATDAQAQGTANRGTQQYHVAPVPTAQPPAPLPPPAHLYPADVRRLEGEREEKQRRARFSKATDAQGTANRGTQQYHVAPLPTAAHAKPLPPPPPGVSEGQYRESQRQAEAYRAKYGGLSAEELANNKKIREAWNKGREYGAIRGEELAYLEEYTRNYGEWYRRATPEQREAEISRVMDRISSRFSQSPPDYDDEILAQVFEAGVREGSKERYSNTAFHIAAAAIAFEFVKYHEIRLPKLEWGKWAGTIAHSKFIFNKEAIAKWGLDKAKAISFKYGKADFSSVAYRLEGKTSFVVEGLTGDRVQDFNKAVETLARRFGTSEREVKNFISSERLVVHHYRGNLMQLVPKNYHSAASHQGTVKDIIALRKLAGGAEGKVFKTLEDLTKGKKLK